MSTHACVVQLATNFKRIDSVDNNGRHKWDSCCDIIANLTKNKQIPTNHMRARGGSRLTSILLTVVPMFILVSRHNNTVCLHMTRSKPTEMQQGHSIVHMYVATLAVYMGKMQHSNSRATARYIQ
jgi:hypothetical protein